MKCWRGCMYCLSQQRTRYRDRRQDVVQEMVQENLQTDHSKSCYRVGWLFKNMLLSYFRKRLSGRAAYHESIQWVMQRFYLWGSCIRGDVVRIRQRKTFIHWGGINLRSESVLDKIKLVLDSFYSGRHPLIHFLLCKCKCTEGNNTYIQLCSITLRSLFSPNLTQLNLMSP